jgi:transporter family-2 protein
MSSWVVVAVAIIGGIAVAVQGQFVGLLDDRLGTQASVLVTYGGGGLVAGLLLALARGEGLSQWRTVPWWAFLAGLLGLVIIGSIGFSVSRIGLVAALTAITVAQFVVGALIDHFGWFGAEIRVLDVGRMAGVALLVLGGWLVLR